MKKLQLTGKVFGKLTVIDQDFSKRGIGTLWKCSCSCGNQVVVLGWNLRSGNTKSCGCISGKGVGYDFSGRERKKERLSASEIAKRFTINGYKAKAKQRGLPWTISEEDFFRLANSDCFYCGSKPSNKIKARRNDSDSHFIYNGIDRINSNFGYIEGNIRSCCFICNRAKSNLTENDFLEWIERLRNNKSVSKLACEG